MADDDTGPAGSTTTTFTQADVDRIVRERLTRERERFKDYDDLKAKAGDADKSKTALDKLLEKVSGLEDRASKAEAAALRADIAQAKGLTPAQAKRLHGSTRDELEADADELRSMFKPKDTDGSDGGGNAGESGSADDKGTDNRSGGGEQASTRGRPREALRSGTAVPAGDAEETNPMKLAEKIPRL